MKKLIVLDINGILCQKYDSKDEHIIKKECKYLKTGRYVVAIRPDINEFLEFCYTNYDVAFFSSTTERNAKNILMHLLTERQLTLTKFMWFRDRVQFDIGGDIENVSKFDTVKNLDQILLNPCVNEHRQYDETNTLIVDNDWKKVRHNKEKNVVLISEFDVFSGSNVTTSDMISIIKFSFENLSS